MPFPCVPRGRNAGQAAQGEVLVWGGLVRVFHWSVVAGCLLNLVVFTDGKVAHRWIGYGVAMALAVRIVWGFVGTRYARFQDFVPHPAALLAYLKALARGREPRFIGHNPAGGVMILALMTLLAAVSLTGWMLTLDAWWGNAALEDLHEALANSILFFAGLHVAGALFESWKHGENLVWSMITGRKRA
jgi:cytochrome b